MLGIVEIPHLRWRLRRQLLHEEQLEAATLAPSPRQADAGEGTGGEEAAGPIAAAAGAARVAGWLARPLTPSLPPSGKRPSLSPSHTPGATRTPPALQPCRPSPLKRHAQAAHRPPVGAPAPARRPWQGRVHPEGRAGPRLRLPGTISPRAACCRRVPELEGSHRYPSPGDSPSPSGHRPSSLEARHHPPPEAREPSESPASRP